MQIDIFHGHAVRTEVKENRVWFNLTDVHNVLGAGKPADTVTRLNPKHVDSIDTLTPGGVQGMHYVSERGLIRVLQTSRSPRAGQFQDWADERVEQLLSGHTVNAAGVVGESEDALILRAITTLQNRLAEQTEELATARPKAAVYDKVLTPEHTFGLRDLTKAVRDKYPVNEADIKRLLTQKGVIIPSRRLDVYSDAITKGYAVRRPSGKWGGKERFQARFTTKTLEWLLEELEPLTEVA